MTACAAASQVKLWPRRHLVGWCLLVAAAHALARWHDPLLSAIGALLALVLLPGLALTRYLPWRGCPASLGELVLASVAIGAAWLILTSLSLVLLGVGLGFPLLVLSDAVAVMTLAM